MIIRSSIQKAFSVAAFASIAIGVTACSSGTTNPAAIVTPTATMTAIPSSPTATVVSTPTSMTQTPAASTLAYKNGTYSADGSYASPAGPEKIVVKLTLVNNVVTAADVTPQAVAPISARFQDQFISGYKQYVVGKNIDEINLSVVSGASLTPKGFKDALMKIKANAKS